ncbi:hypothetical protein MUP51_08515 [Candidatus Bathyarchaeota archaeon]|nr:hypothetical protein [Candidatus Bathyarchaeota archaeon]
MSVKNEIIEKLKKYTTENKAPIIVASQNGKSALKMAEELGKDAKIVAISEFTYSDSVKKDMKKGKITAIENANLPLQDLREMKETLMMFDPGIKAALEVASIAASNRLVDGRYIVVAGGGKGMDTALVINTAHPEAEAISEPLKRLKVERILFSPIIE